MMMATPGDYKQMSEVMALLLGWRSVVVVVHWGMDDGNNII